MGESDQLEEIGQIARVLLATREGSVFGGQARERSTRYDFEREDGFDVIFAARRGQSQKPTEIYELIEQLVPNGKYLEIFARKNNLRDYWVSVGNEVTGTGLPPEDVKAFAEVGAVPAAATARLRKSKTTLLSVYVFMQMHEIVLLIKHSG